MVRKTYAARGLLDWQMALNIGGAIIRICFSGGSMGTNGVIPAKYTTENPAIQRFVEDTAYYKNGRIFLLNETKIKADSTRNEDSKKKR